jgi:hypothetical protein
MSSKRRIRRKSCAGKQRFETAKDALKAIASLHKTKGWQGLLTPYPCQFCNAFHFGHPPAKAARRH